MSRAILVFALWAAGALLYAQTSPGLTQPPLPPITVVLVGDSTVALQGGWGPAFCAQLISSAECIDVAVNGRSTKSFRDEGSWSKALAIKGQFYFIQFGHNDQKDPPALHTDPETTFQANLHRYVQDVRAFGATPVLITPLSRRTYKDGQLVVDPLREYAAATRAVAAEARVPLIDLYRLSRTLLERMTQEQADQFNAALPAGATAAKPDRTHLNDLGKRTFGELVAREAARNVAALQPYVPLDRLPQ
jgi:lysophospholipase L1-like esterase